MRTSAPGSFLNQQPHTFLSYIFKVLHAADLTEDDKSSVWRMFESNMRAM